MFTPGSATQATLVFITTPITCSQMQTLNIERMRRRHEFPQALAFRASSAS
jgi:hypothetical protein